MSINPGTQNIQNLGNSAETLRLIFRALDLKIVAHLPVPTPYSLIPASLTWLQPATTL